MCCRNWQKPARPCWFPLPRYRRREHASLRELLRDAHPDLLLPLATEVAKHHGAVAMLILEQSGQFVLAQNPVAKQNLASVLKEVFAAYSGKGGGTGDFIRAKLTDPRESPQALALAKKLLQV